MNQSASLFRGFSSPTTTSVPDELFDQLMPVLSGAELKVLLYIVRRTFGFKKDADTISLSQLVDGIKTSDGRQLDGGTGLSKAAVAAAIRSLCERGVILATRRQSAERGNEATTYQLRFIAPLSNNQTRGGPKSGQGLVQNLDTQQTGKQQTEDHHQRDDVESELKAFGIEDDIATQLARSYEPAYIRDRLERIRYLTETNPTAIRKTPQAFLVASLKHPSINPAPGYKSPAERQAEADVKAQAKAQAEATIAAEQERQERERAAEQERSAQVLRDLRRRHPPVAIAGTAFTTTTAWSMVLTRLRMALGAANYAAWLSQTILVRCDRSTGIVGTHNPFAARWLHKRFDTIIRAELAAVLGYPVKLEYVPLVDLIAQVAADRRHSLSRMDAA